MGVRQRFRDLTRTAIEHAADELREQSADQGGDKLTDLTVRQPATVCGAVRTVTLPARRGVPALVAELWDGNGSVDLVWVGRRAIGGIVPGVFLRARGRVTVVKGRSTIFNPSYEIVPAP
ncbi:MAG: OB-fold nucleic acid binding domain-containing protein [Dermatophilaceae bacterium]